MNFESDFKSKPKLIKSKAITPICNQYESSKNFKTSNTKLPIIDNGERLKFFFCELFEDGNPFNY